MEDVFSMKKKTMQDGVLSNFPLDIFEDAYPKISLSRLLNQLC